MLDFAAKPGLCTGCHLHPETTLKLPALSGPVDIVVLGDFPKPYDIKRGPFFSQGLSIIRSMLTKMDQQLPRDRQPKRVFAYAVQCCPETYGFKLGTDIYDHCNPHLKIFLDRAAPKVIIALGKEAMRSLGIKGNINTMRGGMYTYVHNHGKAVVIPTYGAFPMTKQPGLVPVVKRDLEKAYLLVGEGLKVEDLDIRMPKTTEDILFELRSLKEIVDTQFEQSQRPLGISIDTETTGLHMYDPDVHLIMISLAWGNDVGLAFPYMHRQAPASDYDLARIKKALEETLPAEKVSLLEHNAKFDYQVLNLRHGFDLPFAAYCSMNAEHNLEEDKSGNYSLKALTKDYIPSLGMYEDELQEALAAVNQERQDAHKAVVDGIKAQRKALMLDHWMGLTEDQRLKHCANWMEAGYALGDYNALITIKRRKLKGEMVVLKKYEAAVEKMLAKISPEDLGIELPGLELPEPEPATFEDIDIDLLLKYAAMDAIVTRRITGIQLGRFAEEDKIIADTERRIRAKLPTRPVKEAFNTYTMPLCRSIAHMEYGGVRLDRDKTQEYATLLEGKLKELSDQLFRNVGYRFSLSSSAPDLRRILFEEKKYDPVKLSKTTDLPSTDAESIKELYDQYDDEFLTTLLAHRKIDKCLNTYLRSWLKRSELDGKIHCNFNQTVAATYRLSSSKPNLGHSVWRL